MKKIITIAVLLGLAIFMWFWASPYWVMYQLNSAFDNNNSAKIEQYIDFPQVRSSLKPQVQQQILQYIGVNDDDYPSVQHLAENLSEQWSARAVDLLVRPQTLQLLMQGKSLKDAVDFYEIFGTNVLAQRAIIFTAKSLLVSSEPSASKRNHPTENRIAGENMYKATTRYEAWNRFEIKVPRSSTQATYFNLQRVGLSWKVVDIRLPKNTAQADS